MKLTISKWRQWWFFALVTTKEKISFFSCFCSELTEENTCFFQILQCHSLELVEALEKTTNMTEEELQQVVPPTWASEPSSLWSDLNGKYWGRLSFTSSNNSWSVIMLTRRLQLLATQCISTAQAGLPLSSGGKLLSKHTSRTFELLRKHTSHPHLSVPAHAWLFWTPCFLER